MEEYDENFCRIRYSWISILLRKMLEAYKESKADRLLLLGDILYHGPRNDLPKEYAPKEVIAMLNPLKQEIYAVRGTARQR